MKVLIADDERLTRAILVDAVRQMGHDVIAVEDGRAALDALGSSAVDLAILDWTMPKLDGVEVCARVRAEQRERYLYLILVSARTRPESVMQGLDAGADDYVAKPFSPVEIHARLRAAERVLAFQREIATYRSYLDEIIVNLDCGVMLSTSAGVLFANGAMALLCGGEGREMHGRSRDEILRAHAARSSDPSTFLAVMLKPLAGHPPVQVELGRRVVEWTSKAVSLAHAPARLDICRDVTSKAALARELADQATRDHLTGLLNRRGGDDVLEREAARASRHSAPLSVLMIDIDHFKRVNDVHGHAAGDRVLAAVARCIQRELRAYDEAVRWGGEEMLVVLPETTSFHATRAAERIRAAVAELRIEPRVTVSIGVAELAGSIEETVEEADDALYAAKSAGRNRVRRAGEERPTVPPMAYYSNPPP